MRRSGLPPQLLEAHSSSFFTSSSTRPISSRFASQMMRVEARQLFRHSVESVWSVRSAIRQLSATSGVNESWTNFDIQRLVNDAPGRVLESEMTGNSEEFTSFACGGCSVLLTNAPAP